MARERLRQRADLTFKQNRQHGRHGWLRLTPAYSVKVVEEVIGTYGAGARRVLEPFNGTGTTPVAAAYEGIDAVGVDINPFLIWLGEVKARTYAAGSDEALVGAAEDVVFRAASCDTEPPPPPPLANIERWWDADVLWGLRAIKQHVDRVEDDSIRDLLQITFCRTMIASSHAAFNHQSMSFKKPKEDAKAAPQLTLLVDQRAGVHKVGAMFLQDARSVAASVPDAPTGSAIFVRDDSRTLAHSLVKEHSPFDLLVTSPPYPNRMSYIRELRPYMYWLGYLNEAKEAGELDWDAIGGTWGTATSKLLTWQGNGAYIPEYLGPICDEIRQGHPKNGILMSQYVLKYFEDMSEHLHRVFELMAPGATVHYIIGNSTFYGHVVPAERLYADMLKHAGFEQVDAKAIRKRNSKKELFEFHVSAVRPV
jgi:hypothetical protein